MFATLSISAILFAAYAHAHGIVHSIAINGKTTTSPDIGTSDPTGPFTVPKDNSPITDPSSALTLCGNVDRKASSSLTVAAGSTLEYSWKSGYSNEAGNWPHDTGPMFWYMAKCPDSGCNSISSSTKFYKLKEVGFVSNGVWGQAAVHDGNTVSFTVPSDLEAGDYVIRHELINLAIGIELFPSCANVKVTGSGNKSLSGASATFPGAYQSSDAGLAIGGAAVYGISSNSQYKFPGPVLATIGGAGTGDNSGSATTTAASSSSTGSGAISNAGGSPPDDDGDDCDPETDDNCVCTDDGDSDDSDSTTTTDISTETATQTATATETASTSTSTDTSSSGSGSGSSSTDCVATWNACNAKYKGTADDQANYHCQTDYTSCIAKTLANVKRMHRRRSIFH